MFHVGSQYLTLTEIHPSLVSAPHGVIFQGWMFKVGVGTIMQGAPKTQF